MCFLLCFHLVQGSGFRALVAASPPFLLGDARKEKGRAKGAGWICPAGASFYVADNVLLAGIVSHAWHEVLRLSPHLFWLGLFIHRAFSSAQDDDTGERKGFHLGDMLRVLELSVLYTIRVGPWRRAAPKAQDGST